MASRISTHEVILGRTTANLGHGSGAAAQQVIDAINQGSSGLPAPPGGGSPTDDAIFVIRSRESPTDAWDTSIFLFKDRNGDTTVDADELSFLAWVEDTDMRYHDIEFSNGYDSSV